MERSATERNEGQQENLQKFQDGSVVYAVHHTANESVVRLSDCSTTSVVSIQFVDGAKGMLLRFLRITENKLMSMRQIRMRKNQILKNIQNLSTERVLHDPAELFVHLCVSTCDGKR